MQFVSSPWKSEYNYQTLFVHYKDSWKKVNQTSQQLIKWLNTSMEKLQLSLRSLEASGQYLYVLRELIRYKWKLELQFS